MIYGVISTNNEVCGVVEFARVACCIQVKIRYKVNVCILKQGRRDYKQTDTQLDCKI